MVMQVSVFDRSGNAIGEIRPYVHEVSWRLGDFGRVRFSMSKNDSRATSRFLQFGNLILVEFDNGLPDWGGVIDPPRDWTKEFVDCTAYSGEYLLMLRQTDQGRYFSSEPVGTIARKLVEEANSTINTGLTIGSIWVGGDLHGPEYHYKNLHDIYTKSLFDRLSTADFAVIPSIVNKKLVFTLNVYERRGADKLSIALHEGFNIEDGARLSEQGPIHNSVVVVGDGVGWGDNRPTATSINQSSIDLYGLRETSAIMVGVSSPITLQAAADTEAAKNSQPHNILTIAVANKAPGTFVQYDIGDTVTAELPGYGFGGFRASVQVLARTFYPQEDVCGLIVREVI